MRARPPSPRVLALLLVAACGDSTHAGGSGIGDSGSPDASVVEPPSCAVVGPGLTNCGASRESCCTSLAVTGGTFYRNWTDFPATLSAFRLDKYDVTVGRFRRFVAAWNAGYEPTPGSGKHAYLNDGKGLATGGVDAGDGYEPGWAATYNVNVSPTDANLECGLPDPGYFYTWTTSAGARETDPNRLRELVRSVRVLHLGWRLPPDRGRGGLRRGRR